ncbi:MAG: threonine/serine exporter family protein [Lactobacillus sp.]|uniref:Threonine/serine exporter n=1 Tax=Bombilactobacillus bombi TaxID=1303590 RepID=A0A347ST53_9LACO|nr:threonine/serine exporter family protein [Bombilactobacillus bombi]MCO6542105.1 threonine/serine exporter family protein [Lactobacillus sp.]AXX65212.1 threonine/serine exporter [Bombilactobacillus bombi]MCO6543729.1 threonine/serine exporter family protein [Lactobacillus sp.]RHW46274.1 threonine/serine exporter [Bombilactobacillus bombi]RHW52385.1 threonine/serine exporter [Bombilactobacillus bombi]
MAKVELTQSCLLAGKILVESGSEMYRVEDTMRRIACAGDEEHNAAFTSLTGVLISIRQAPYTRFMQVTHRGIDMNRIAKVNTLSRQFVQHEISLAQLQQALQQIEQEKPLFPLWIQTLGAGLESACLMIIFTQHYDWWDFPWSFLIGASGYLLTTLISQRTRIRFVSELLGSFFISLLTLLLVRSGLGHNASNIIIGAIMPLVPGVPMTNALRDLIEGNLLAGMQRGMESLMVVGAIAIGVAVGFYLHI